VLSLSKAIEREVESMKMPPLVLCLRAISFFALSPASRAAPPGGGGGSFHGGGFHGGFAGHGSGRAFSMGGHSVVVHPHFSRASGFARGLGSRDAPLRAGRRRDIGFWRHDDGRFRDRDFGRHGDSRDTTNAIVAISSTILISLRSVFLIGGTLTTETSTTDIPTRMRITIPHRLTATSIGKIWR
jgi:hypothetical protein